MEEADLDAVAELAREDESAWTLQDYLKNETVVAVLDGGVVAGLAAARTLVPQVEYEVLNVLVGTRFRGQGIGCKLMKKLMGAKSGLWFLEVRESNAIARRLYKSIGFNDFGRRKGYFQNPYEDAIVMRYCS
jgi:ribosomal-protein-alanine acetyltransferase